MHQKVNSIFLIFCLNYEINKFKFLGVMVLHVNANFLKVAHSCYIYILQRRIITDKFFFIYKLDHECLNLIGQLVMRLYLFFIISELGDVIIKIHHIM